MVAFLGIDYFVRNSGFSLLHYLFLLVSAFFCSAVAFYIFRTYRTVIRHSSLREVWKLGAATLLKELLMLLILWFWPDGLAQAFLIGERFIGDDTACLVLGDNIFYGAGFSEMLREAVRTAEGGKATVFGYWVKDPERYGVAEFDRKGNCLSIEEKPKEPKSNYAVVGLYFYPNKVVDVAKRIKPSARGELEITTVNQEFLQAGELKVQTLSQGFAWLDTGTHDSLAEASIFVEVIEKRQGLKIACLEDIAFRQGWITAEKMRELAQPMAKNPYGQYLLKQLEQIDR